MYMKEKITESLSVVQVSDKWNVKTYLGPRRDAKYYCRPLLLLFFRLISHILTS